MIPAYLLANALDEVPENVFDIKYCDQKLKTGTPMGKSYTLCLLCKYCCITKCKDISSFYPKSVNMTIFTFF